MLSARKAEHPKSSSGGVQMDITSVFSGIMIGAGLGLAFCVIIMYKHHREAIMDKTSSIGK